ncbi:hypothetical protein IE044AEMC_01507 [Enterococcus faecalis]|nr:hypothetical protein IE313HC_01276 [Enterococcus faecalis]CAC9764721.1 hypothetical protein IE044AEGC_01341 [Enterococcus faecalis]CAC9770241.1 hypothetical protein IE183ART_02503 [Enterococcus faecalis]CAC9778610.1 hypothetical protein IE044AEMC_01507 [Enterococcus faecalis]CAC9780109.1 hypothetical protein IE044CO2MC_01273 [Enterococcus faecalis]
MLDNSLESLRALYYDINSIQKQFYDDLELMGVTHRINYSKIEVRQILNSKNHYSQIFLEYLQTYISELNKLSLITIPVLEEKYNHLNLRTRVKNHRSISDKLQQYNSKGDVPGAYVIQKCLNDLFGFRIIIDNPVFNKPEFITILDECKSKKIVFREYLREDGNYRGHHSYFKNKSNLFLPWELQIWYTQDVESNYSSHFEHKQKYLVKERGVTHV